MNGLFSTTDHIVSALDDLFVDVRCGLHAWERHAERPTRLRFSVKLYARLDAARVAAEPILDYDRVRDHIRGFQALGHVELLETLVDDVTQVCFADPRVVACFVSVRKPDIFNEAAGAGIDVFRTRAGWEKGG